MKGNKCFIVFELKQGMYVQVSVKLDVIRAARDVKESLERATKGNKKYEIFELTQRHVKPLAFRQGI